MFAIEAVLDIAYNGLDQLVQSRSIASRQGVPKRYLEQVLQLLVRANILAGVRGPRGGYRLARERRHITIADILAVIVDSEMEGETEKAPVSGSELGRHALAPLWRHLDAQVMELLARTNIEDLCDAADAAGCRPEAMPQGGYVI